jgi:hypothetical protein
MEKDPDEYAPANNNANPLGDFDEDSAPDSPERVRESLEDWDQLKDAFSSGSLNCPFFFLTPTCVNHINTQFSLVKFVSQFNLAPKTTLQRSKRPLTKMIIPTELLSSVFLVT